MKPPVQGKRTRKTFTHASERCQSRSCPRCARIRAAHYHEFGAAVADVFDATVPVQLETWGDFVHRPRFVTLTSVRDPSSEAAHTIAALRDRADGLRRAIRAIVAWLRDTSTTPKMIGAFVALELAGTGHVHAHILFHGPWVFIEEWETIGRAGYIDSRGREYPGYPDLGFGKAKLADRETIQEVAKYPLKTPGSGAGAESWIAGKKIVVMHPRLVARWEIATLGSRLVERYGLCRKVKLPDEAEENEETTLPPAPAEPCKWCGCLNTKIVTVPTADWLALCRTHRRADKVRFAAFGPESKATRQGPGRENGNT